MTKVFSNTNLRGDFLGFELEKYGKKTNVYIASAFFTHERFVKDLVDKGCTVWLVVRLGFPTSAHSLKKILPLRNVYIRYYTATEFHPKLYIFGDKIAFVGSSNFTDSGLFSNQELNLSIDAEEPSFGLLQEIFEEYWEAAVPLTQETLNEYAQITADLQNINEKAKIEIHKKLGKVIFPNIKRLGEKPQTKSSLYLQSFLQKYQLFLGEFENLKEIYQSVGQRKISEDVLPLKIEIDRFLSWIRLAKAGGNLYKEPPHRKGEDAWQDFILSNISEFLASDYDYINEVAKYHYPTINANLASISSIHSLTEQQLRETVVIVHAFESMHRFYEGGLDTLLDAFISDNGIEKIKLTLKYLLFGTGNFAQRIAECIYNREYKLRHFGESCVKETYGWVNSEDVPLCNERMLKSMQWLGFGEM